VYLSTYPSIYLSIHPSISVYICLPTYQPIYNLPNYRQIYLVIRLPIRLSASLSIYPPTCLSIYRLLTYVSTHAPNPINTDNISSIHLCTSLDVHTAHLFIYSPIYPIYFSMYTVYVIIQFIYVMYVIYVPIYHIPSYLPAHIFNTHTYISTYPHPCNDPSTLKEEHQLKYR
jgi:hypothetical protein